MAHAVPEVVDLCSDSDDDGGFEPPAAEPAAVVAEEAQAAGAQAAGAQAAGAQAAGANPADGVAENASEGEADGSGGEQHEADDFFTACDEELENEDEMDEEDEEDGVEGEADEDYEADEVDEEGDEDKAEDEVDEGDEEDEAEDAVDAAAGAEGAAAAADGPGPSNVRARPKSKSARAGLQLPVARFKKNLRKAFKAGGVAALRDKDGHPLDFRLSDTAAVYLTGTMEFLVSELLDITDKEVKDEKKKRIEPHHIKRAVDKDKEFDELLKRVVIPGGGVVPHIHPVLKKRRRH